MNGTITGRIQTISSDFFIGTATAGASLAFKTGNNTERMRIDSSGNLAVGVTSAAYLSRATFGYDPITTNGPISVDTRAFAINGGGAYYMGGQYNTAGNYRAYAGVAGLKENSTDGNSAGYMSFFTNGNAADPAERMRIDSSGNLLVGTDSAFGTTGTTINAAGLVYSSADGDRSGQFDRTGVSDGEIVRFSKAGTTVGSIGTTSGVVTHIVLDPRSTLKGAGIIGGSISASEGVINPTDKTGGIENGNINLGGSGSRWKDLYLAGGVYLGGTGSANYLDDYEEGTFTPQVWVGTTQQTLSRADGAYVKIGDYVFYQAAIIVSGAISGSGTVQIRNFPFSFGGFGPGGNARASGSVGYNSASTMPMGILGGVSVTYVDLYTNATAGTAGSMTTNIQGSDLPSGWNMYFTVQTRIA